MTTTTSGTNMASLGSERKAAAAHDDGARVSSVEEFTANAIKPHSGAINLMLICSCLAFGAASFLFGYDDKVISPVAATQYFVCTRYPFSLR
jgi:hypothetical protein